MCVVMAVVVDRAVILLESQTPKTRSSAAYVSYSLLAHKKNYFFNSRMEMKLRQFSFNTLPPRRDKTQILALLICKRGGGASIFQKGETGGWVDECSPPPPSKKMNYQCMDKW